MFRILEIDDDVFDIVADSSEGAVEILGNADIAETADGTHVLRLSRVHVHGPGPNRIGLREIRKLAKEFAQFVMEQTDAHTVVIEGAKRTTGANPGRAPSPWTFERKENSR